MTKQDKNRKPQDDRLLKRLPLGQRRQQEQLRKLIKADTAFAAV